MQQKQHINRKWLAIGVVTVIVLLLANVWVGYETFFAQGEKNAPRIKLNPFSATSLVFKTASQKDLLTWDSPKNILILGRSGGDYIAPHLTDTIMVLSIDPLLSPPKISLVSIPRDLLIKLDDPERFLKINSLWPYLENTEENGINLIKEKIESVTSLSIDSILIFDLGTVKRVIEKIDGITVLVNDDIYDPKFPREGGGYETFSLQKGWRYLSAEEAIKFVRTRYSTLGDFDRIMRQQEILKAVKGKVTSLNPIWNLPTLWSVFSTLRNGLITDLTFEDLENLWAISQRVPLDAIQTLSIDTSTGLIVPRTTYFGGVPAYTLVASEEPFDYVKIQEAIRKFLK